MKTFIFLPHVLLLLSIMIFLPLTQCSAILIDNTCKQTPYYNLCVSSLRSNPRSSNADVLGLARIAVDIVSGSVADSLKHISELHRRTRDSKLQQALGRCSGKYKVVLEADVPVAVEALTKGDYKFAEESMNDAANEADSCAREFGSRLAILADSNKRAHDLCVVASAIVRILLRG